METLKILYRIKASFVMSLSPTNIYSNFLLLFEISLILVQFTDSGLSLPPGKIKLRNSVSQISQMEKARWKPAFEKLPNLHGFLDRHEYRCEYITNPVIESSYKHTHKHTHTQMPTQTQNHARTHICVQT